MQMVYMLSVTLFGCSINNHDFVKSCLSFSLLVCSLDPLPLDCQEAYVLGCTRSGVYTIDPGCGKPFSVWCDMNNGGGWTVFQRRNDGSENFYRGWTEYENGFGNVKGEFWLGLKKISCLTKVSVKTKLRIDLADFAGHSKYACYDYFHVGTPSTNYKLTIGGYQNWGIGAAGDSMTRHNLNGMPFSTYDRDNDRYSGNWLLTGKVHGGITLVPTQTSMGCTSMVRVTAMASHGTISMLLHQVITHSAIQT